MWFGLVILAAMGAVAALVPSRAERYRAYLRAYEEAERLDKAYAADHPGCTRDEAHVHRDAVNRKYHM